MRIFILILCLLFSIPSYAEVIEVPYNLVAQVRGIHAGVAGAAAGGGCSSSCAYVAYVKGSADGSSDTLATDSTYTSTTGRTLVAIAATDRTDKTISSITDGTNNFTYINRKVHASAGYGTVELWYAKNITGVSNSTFTATWNAATTYRRLVVIELSGCSTSEPYDVNNVGTGSTETTLTTANATTTCDNDLIIAGYTIYADRTFTQGSGWTMVYSASGSYFGVEYKDDIGAAGDYGSTISVNLNPGGWVGIHGAFK